MINLDNEKVGFILDLIRRACANGTHRQVAEVLAYDWNPPIIIDEKGKSTFKISYPK